MSIGIRIGNESCIDNIVGHVLVAVVKHEDGGLTIERDIQVNADSREDNDVVEGFIKAVEKKLAEALPVEPEAEPEVKIWVPA